MNPIQFIDKNKELIINTYNDLHQIAEPSWQEERTSSYLKKRLLEAGLEVKTFEHHFGFIAEIKGQLSSVVALRADMDALFQEVDGELKANHSCGHDAHSTMVLYAALAIASSGMQPKHTLRFIFQPAEEKGEGALQMMKDGVLDQVISLFGTHLRPKKEVPFYKASPVIIHGSAETIKGTIKGIQAHAARPHEGINVIEVSSMIVQSLKNIDLVTEVPFSIKMTQLHIGNEASNIIPENANFAIDVRAQTNELMNQLNEISIKIFENAMEETGAKITWAMEEFVPAAITNEKAINYAEAAITTIIGEENLMPHCISQGGEDFHFYTNKYPSIAATMIGLGCDLTPGLHHPHMRFNLEALIYGAKILTETVLNASKE
ncbi:M20 peptidase aminoacylase family protein [Bacillus sp. EAC]|uniref:M20 peptidase aminoacylase family protein n=1 Tax=Bacillus sp. EAC TaxID=1978338 RepID=UPI000B44A701|nr:M20 peptidase aminoacylase family protein [Bacillus sp. EAC]